MHQPALRPRNAAFGYDGSRPNTPPRQAHEPPQQPHAGGGSSEPQPHRSMPTDVQMAGTTTPVQTIPVVSAQAESRPGAMPSFVPNHQQSADLITALRRHIRPSSLQGGGVAPLQGGLPHRSVHDEHAAAAERPLSSRGNLPRSGVRYSDWVAMQNTVANSSTRPVATKSSSTQGEVQDELPPSGNDTSLNPMQQYLAGELSDPVPSKRVVMRTGNKHAPALATAVDFTPKTTRDSPPKRAVGGPSEPPPHITQGGDAAGFGSRADMGLELSDDEGGLF